MLIKYTNLIDLMCKIKEYMQLTNIKITDVAQRTNLSKSTISNLLNARQKTITLDNLNRVANALDCNLYIELRPRHNRSTKHTNTNNKNKLSNTYNNSKINNWIDL